MSVCLRLYEDEIYMVIKSDIYLLLSHTRAELRRGRAFRRRGRRPTDNQLRETDRQTDSFPRHRVKETASRPRFLLIFLVYGFAFASWRARPFPFLTPPKGALFYSFTQLS